MKKLLLSLVVLSLGASVLMAGWTTPPPANVSVGTQVTVAANGTANSGSNPLSYLVLWVQDPSGTWTHPVLGVGVNQAMIGGSVNWTLNTAGTWHWQVTTTAGSPTGSTPYGTTWATATTQVNPAGPTPTTFSFSNLSFTYDGSSKTASVTPNPGNATYTADLTKGPNAGSYTVTATATGNFTGSGSATLVINQAPASFAWSGGPTFTYDGSSKSVAVSVSPSGATYNQSGTWSAANPGSYTATATASGNYSGSSSYSWSIGPANPAPPAPSAGGYELDYQYNNRDRLTAVKCADGTTLAAFSYTIDAQRSGRSVANGTQTSYSYDAAGRLTQVQASGILNQRYGRDLRDRRIWSLRDEAYGDTYEYLPDGELNRYRHQVWRPDQNFWNSPVWTDEFAYDGSGNRTSWNENGTVTSYQADALNQYTAVSGATLAYSDGRANLTQWQGWSYTYDADNHLTVAQAAGTRVEFYYDAEGRLMKLNRNGAWEYRYYDGAQCYQRIDAGGGLIDWMVWGPTPDEVLERYSPANGGWQYYHQDAVNSVVAITGQAGNVLERYLYDSFGSPDIRDSAWNSRSATAIGNLWLFTGQEWRDDVQLCNYKNRWYHPQLGRFLQNDPVRYDGGDLNLYRYCGNDPYDRTDPSGLDSSDIPSYGIGSGTPGAEGAYYGTETRPKIASDKTVRKLISESRLTVTVAFKPSDTVLGSVPWVGKLLDRTRDFYINKTFPKTIFSKDLKETRKWAGVPANAVLAGEKVVSSKTVEEFITVTDNHGFNEPGGPVSFSPPTTYYQHTIGGKIVDQPYEIKGFLREQLNTNKIDIDSVAYVGAEIQNIQYIYETPK